MDRKPDRTPRNSSTERILAVIRAIPKGKVTAYGHVAAFAGIPRGARQVARILHALSEREKLPWHRIINGAGKISLPMDGPGRVQRKLLIKEGVRVDEEGRVDVRKHGWNPEPPKGSSRR
jgi:methylated-DNA-protein-cysteine methyltransferase-like protein